jgi:hypothetical protein
MKIHPAGGQHFKPVGSGRIGCSGAVAPDEGTVMVGVGLRKGVNP